MTQRTGGAAGDRRLPGLRALAILLTCLGAAVSAGAFEELDEAEVRFERNATDGDFEFVFEIKGQDDGLERVTVVSPDGRTVIDFTAPDRSTLGMRYFKFESPEPPDYDLLTGAYPEGTYRFTATTAAGELLTGEADLSHELPPTVTGLSPPEEATGVALENLVISWNPVQNAAAYFVELEQDDLEVALEATLPASTTSFAVPGGFLEGGMEYQLGIGTISEDGNISVVETTFTTIE